MCMSFAKRPGKYFRAVSSRDLLGQLILALRPEEEPDRRHRTWPWKPADVTPLAGLAYRRTLVLMDISPHSA